MFVTMNQQFPQENPPSHVFRPTMPAPARLWPPATKEHISQHSRWPIRKKRPPTGEPEWRPPRRGKVVARARQIGLLRGILFWNLHQPNFMGLKSKVAWVVSHCSHLPRPHSLLMVALSCTASSPNSSVRAVWNCFPETDPILELPRPPVSNESYASGTQQGYPRFTYSAHGYCFGSRFYEKILDLTCLEDILRIMTMSKLYQRDKIWLTGGAHPKKYFSLGMIIPNMLQPAEVNCAVHFSETRFFWTEVAPHCRAAK